MKILRILLFAALLLVAALLIAGLFAPKGQEVKKSIEIDAPPSAIFLHIKYFDKYAKWNPWLSKDQNIQLSTQGKDGTLGAKRIWRSSVQDVGEGSDEIVAIVENQSLSSKLEFVRPRPGRATNVFDLVDVGGKTRVNWTFNFDVPYPWNAFMLFSGDFSEIEEQFGKGLISLKQTLEKFERSAVNYMTTDIKYEGKLLAAKRGQIKYEAVSDFCQASMDEILAAMKSKGALRKGTPTLLFYDWNEETNDVDVAYGIPVSNGTVIDGLDMIKVPGSDNGLKAVSVGDRSRTIDVHRFMKKKFTADGREIDMPFIEEFVKGPLSAVPNQKGKVTNVVYFYK